MPLTCSAVDLATAKAKITINFVCPILLKSQMWLIVIKRNVFVVWGIIHRPPYESRTIHGKPQSLVDEKLPIMKEKANKTQNIAHREKIHSCYVSCNFLHFYWQTAQHWTPTLHKQYTSTETTKKATSPVVRLGDDWELQLEGRS